VRSVFGQAEDGIRGFHVTGVQTCALPILCVAHLAEGVLALAAEQIVAAEVGASGGGEHLAQEDGLELLRGAFQALALAFAAGGSGKGGQGPRRNRNDHITTISALSDPARLSASRTATRSAGVAPSMLSASTTWASEAPGSN